ncbi:MAG: fasciclin domain-containing protein [Flavisolibacter sp.]
MSLRIFPVLILLTTVLSCKKWDDHTDVANPAVQTTLFDEISSNSSLSKFAEYLLKTGLDQELRSSKNFTVWAPANTALQSLDPAVVADTSKLRRFLENHISGEAWYTSMAGSGIRVPLLNGKQSDFSKNKFDQVTITQADIKARNGVLHLIDNYVAPLPNAWEFVNATATQYKQNAFILSQNYTFQDPSLAVIDSISSSTGLPVYHPGTGMVTRNYFNDQVYDLSDEKKLYTYFVLNDNALKVETDSLLGFYKTSTADSTNNLATMNVVKDVVVEGQYSIDQLPAVLQSKFGVSIPIDKNAIISSQRLSNGVVYVLSKLDFLTAQKIPNVVVQGENPRGFYNAAGVDVDVRSTSFYRIRTNPLTGKVFNDLYIYNHNVSGLNVLYRATNLPSAKYKVYWVAVNDTLRVSSVVNPASYPQRLAMGSRTATNFANVTVAVNNYNEVYLGEYTQQSYGNLDMFLTASGTNRLSLDYIRLEPEF